MLVLAAFNQQIVAIIFASGNAYKISQYKFAIEILIKDR